MIKKNRNADNDEVGNRKDGSGVEFGTSGRMEGRNRVDTEKRENGMHTRAG